MELYDRNYLVARLLAGTTSFKVGAQRYKVVPPTSEKIFIAEELAKEATYALSFKQLLREEDAKEVLNRLGIWTDKDEKALEDSREYIDDLKVALFKSLHDKKAQKAIKQQLKGVRDAISASAEKKYYLAHLTYENHRQSIRSQFLTALCIVNEEGDFLFNEKDLSGQDAFFIEAALVHIQKQNISPEEVRELSRTDPWRSYWASGKEGTFGVSSAQLNEDQRLLISFSNMYQNAYKHPDCPPDEVFEDDDMFDGWMIADRRKREKESKQKRIDNLVDQKGDEIFVMAHNPEAATEIADANDHSEKMRLRDRMRQVMGSEKPLDELELQDVQMKLRREMMHKKQ